MRAPPMDWRGFLTDWVWLFAKTAVTSAMVIAAPVWMVLVPMAIFMSIGSLVGAGSISSAFSLLTVVGFFVAFVLATVIVGMATIGLPLTVYFIWRGGESKRAYKWAGAVGGAAIAVLASNALNGAMNGAGFGSVPSIMLAMGYCAAVGAITASLWWQNARDPHVGTAGGFA